MQKLMGEDYTASFETADIENYKILSLFSYIWFLFLIPLFAAPNSKYARFHANQGLLLFIVTMIYDVIKAIIYIPFRIGNNLWNWDWSWGWGSFHVWSWNPVTSVFDLIGLVFLAVMIYGIYNAVTGRAKELPLIGRFRIIM